MTSDLLRRLMEAEARLRQASPANRSDLQIAYDRVKAEADADDALTSDIAVREDGSRRSDDAVRNYEALKEGSVEAAIVKPQAEADEAQDRADQARKDAEEAEAKAKADEAQAQEDAAKADADRKEADRLAADPAAKAESDKAKADEAQAKEDAAKPSGS